MTQTALSGPGIFFGQESPGPDNNEARGPSVFDQAWMLMDPQAPYAYAGGNSWWGWMSGGEYVVADYIPGTASASAVAGAQTSTGALVLATASAAPINISASVVNINTGLNVTGLLAVDSLSGQAQLMGLSGFGKVWNVANGCGRNISITTGATSGTSVVTVAGFDYRGVPMTEAITASASGSLTVGAKAFKFIQSVTPATAVNGMSAGIGTLVGLPLRCDQFAYLTVNNNNTAGTSGNFTAAVTSSATATTGDVRGTYALGTITATSRVIIFERISPININTLAGLVGVTQA